MKKQYVITEKNQWEGETFKYVLYLSDDEVKLIEQKMEEYGRGALSIEPSDFDDGQIRDLNKLSDNCYMDFIAAYKLEDSALADWKNFGDCFYKGVGLIKLRELEKSKNQ